VGDVCGSLCANNDRMRCKTCARDGKRSDTSVASRTPASKRSGHGNPTRLIVVHLCARSLSSRSLGWMQGRGQGHAGSATKNRNREPVCVGCVMRPNDRLRERVPDRVRTYLSRTRVQLSQAATPTGTVPFDPLPPPPLRYGPCLGEPRPAVPKTVPLGIRNRFSRAPVRFITKFNRVSYLKRRTYACVYFKKTMSELIQFTYGTILNCLFVY
jgi:hypothetical protein